MLFDFFEWQHSKVFQCQCLLFQIRFFSFQSQTWLSMPKFRGSVLASSSWEVSKIFGSGNSLHRKLCVCWLWLHSPYFSTFASKNFRNNCLPSFCHPSQCVFRRVGVVWYLHDCLQVSEVFLGMMLLLQISSINVLNWMLLPVRLKGKAAKKRICDKSVWLVFRQAGSQQRTKNHPMEIHMVLCRLKQNKHTDDYHTNAIFSV